VEGGHRVENALIFATVNMLDIVVPEWVRHGPVAERASIYSCHINASGTHLATGGGDCRVKIWSLDPIWNEASTSPKLLCVSNVHSEPVNCVRWSPCGHFLATCSGDKIVFVLRKGAQYSKPMILLGEKEPNYENWEEHARFLGHTCDVLHVAWCPKTPPPGRLASCGLDRNIIVWQVGTREPIKKIETNFPCKGIAWDPIGTYLAGQVSGGEGANHQVCVWRISDWKLESTTVKGFESPDDTSFLRLSWSPDGQQLATVCKKKNASVSTALTCSKQSMSVLY
jgi:WD40 repeat protein